MPTCEHTIQIPPGLQLSTRRGPEVELYDVVGRRLLSSPKNTQTSRNSSNSAAFGCNRKSLLAPCWSSRGRCGDVCTRSNEASVVLVNKSTNISSLASRDFSLGRLPTKVVETNGGCHLVRRSLCLGADSSPNRKSSFHRIPLSEWCGSFPRCLLNLCTGSTSTYDVKCSLTNEQNRYYKHGFSHPYRRFELSAFLLLLICLSVLHTTLLITCSVSSYGRAPPKVTYLNLSYSEWIRVSLLSMAAFLSLLGLGLAHCECVYHPVSHKSDSSDSSTRDAHAGCHSAVGRQMTNLLVARRIHRHLRRLHGLGYLSCFFLAVGMLPWLSLCQLLDSSDDTKTLPSYMCVHNFSAPTHESEIRAPVPLRSSSWNTRQNEFTDPCDSLWVVLLIVVGLHGLFDLDGFVARHWRYAFTTLICLAQVILSNTFYLIRLVGINLSVVVATGNFCSSSVTSHVAWVQPVPWWDSRVGILCRTNVITFFGLVAAHVIGRAIGTFTIRHRHRLFIVTLVGQTRLHHLQLTERKLDQVASCLVPAPLASELGRDFVAGYLAWRSPLVIYLRNVSFLTVELIGLSSLASVIASSASVTTTASQQFVTIVNNLFGCFDRIAEREGCYRVRLNSQEYLCIAGYPDNRVDHARSCVESGLAMLSVVHDISEMANVHLELRVAVHTGTAYAAVLGQTRLGFELTGDDVLFASHIRQAAVRPRRVLVSRTTFNQLPEGFRGEAGPIFEFSFSSVDQAASPSTTDTYFVQPRKTQSKTAGPESSFAECDLTSTCPPSDRPRLSDFELSHLGLLVRLLTATTAGCRRASGHTTASHSTGSLETPFDSLFVASSPLEVDIDALKDLRLRILHTLSENEFSDILCDSQTKEQCLINGPVTRDPSTSELLALAAVSLAQSYEQETSVVDGTDKSVPCQRRAGKLRRKVPNGCADPFEVPVPAMTNSADTSLIAASSSSANPTALSPDTDNVLSIYSWNPMELGVQRLCFSPPGCVAPHWLTMRTNTPLFTSTCYHSKMDYCNLSETRSVKGSCVTRGGPLEWAANCLRCSRNDSSCTLTEMGIVSPPDQLAHIMSFTTTVLIPFVMMLALIHLIAISRFFLFVVIYVVLLAYLGFQLAVLNISRRFSLPPTFIQSTICRTVVLISFGLAVATSLASLSMCRPALLTDLSMRNSTTSIFLTKRVTNGTTYHLCPILGHFTILSGLVCLLPALCYQSVMFASAMECSQNGSRVTPGSIGVLLRQSTRFYVGLIVLLLHIGVYLWTTLYGGMDHRLRQVDTLSENASTGHHVEFHLFYPTFVHTFIGLFISSLLAFLLPRNLEYQSIVLRQWTIKTRELHHSLLDTRLALARLLTSVAPRFVLCRLFDPSNPVELYSESHPFVGLVVIQLTGRNSTATSAAPGQSVDSSETTTNNSASRTNEPALIADRLRLMNHLISAIDNLANGKENAINPDANDQKSDGIPFASSVLTKVHVGGTSIGYAVGLSSSTGMHDAASQSASLTQLLTFTEHVLKVCDEANSKANSTSNVVNARIALHAGPALVGLVGKQRPVFNIWGDPVNICLHLIQESQVPALYRQHLLLATDEVISAIPITRLTASSVSGQPLIWRCVDPQAGLILPSEQMRAPSTAPGGPSTSRPLHFCALPTGLTGPANAHCVNKATFAIINLAKRASMRTPHAVRQRDKPQPDVQKSNISPEPKIPHTTTSATVPLPPSAVVLTAKSPVYSVGGIASPPPTFKRYSLAHEMPSLSPQYVSTRSSPPPPPPPPPHQRLYPVTRSPVVLPTPDGLSSNPQSDTSFYTDIARVSRNDQFDSPTSHPFAGPKYCEPPSTATRQAFRRGVPSHFTTSHDYSIVHVEPRSPTSTQPTRPVLTQRRQTQLIHQPSNQPSSRLTDYWPMVDWRRFSGGALQNEIKSCTKSTVPTQFNRFSSCSVPSANAGRPSSLSSTDSFLAAERACAAESEARTPTEDFNAAGEMHEIDNEDDSVSHHNPLYTDNEYESMTDSQDNLADIDPCRPIPRTVLSECRLTGCDPVLTFTNPNLLSPQHTDLQPGDCPGKKPKVLFQPHSVQRSFSPLSNSNTFFEAAKCGLSGGQNGQWNQPSLCVTPVSDQFFNFPDIQRPSSPAYLPDKSNLHLMAEAKLTNVRLGQTIITSNTLTGSLLTEVRPTSVTVAQVQASPHVFPHGLNGMQLSFSGSDGAVPCGIGWTTKHPSQCAPSRPLAFSSEADGNYCATSDVDATETEYAGTYSLGPLSMAVQPSVDGDGLTSCDEGETDYICDTSHLKVSDRALHGPMFHHLPTDSPTVAHLVPNSCMTDSLLANPDLEARGSELGDDDENGVNPSNEMDFHCIPHHQNRNPGLFSDTKAVVDVLHTIRPQEADLDEVFAYHIRPGFFPGHPFFAQVSSQHNSTVSCVSNLAQNFASPSKNPHDCRLFSPLRHATMGECSPAPQYPRPSLPEIAPVHLPDFSQHSTSSDAIKPVNDHTSSEYDNLCPITNSLRLKGCPVPERFAFRSASHALKSDWAISVVGEESDTMSGYVGDAASSVYDTGDEEYGNNKTSNLDMKQLPSSDVPLLSNAPFAFTPMCPPSVVQHDLIPDKRHDTSFQCDTVEGSALCVTHVATVEPVGSQSNRFTQDCVLERLSPPAESPASSVNQQRSEYDNVDRSTGSSATTGSQSSELSKPLCRVSRTSGRLSRTTNTHGCPRHSGSLDKMFQRRGDINRCSIFDAEIVAEARRISRQFRALGWIPGSDYFPPSMELLSAQQFGAVETFSAGESLVSAAAPVMLTEDGSPLLGDDYDDDAYRPRHLFLLPLSSQVTTPRHTSFRRSHPRRSVGSVAQDSDTATSVTSHFGEAPDDASQTDASLDDDDGEEEEELEWTTAPALINVLRQDLPTVDAFSNHRLHSGLRPRSWSTTCLDTSGFEKLRPPIHPLLASSSVVSSDDDEPMAVDQDIAQSGEQPPDMLRRCHSSRCARRSHRAANSTSCVSPRFIRIQQRAARVRSFIPLELQRFILPSCMSSLSSSLASSSALHQDLIFLSLARERLRPRRLMDRKRTRSLPRYHLPRSFSDPELHVT